MRISIKNKCAVLERNTLSWTRLFFGLLLMCLACVDPYAPDLLSIDYGILVIDGYFVPNDTTRMRLSRTATIDGAYNGMQEPAADVRIEGDNGFAVTLTPGANHNYTTPPVTTDPHARYRLIVRTSDDREYASEFVPLATKTSLDSVVIHELPGGEEVTFNVFSHDPNNASWYYSYQFDETWEYIAKDYSVYEFKNGEIVPRQTAADLYTCWQTRASTDITVTTTSQLSSDLVYDFPIVRMRQSDRRLYFAYSLNARQYGLSAAAFSYWKIVRENSEELGTLSDAIPAQPKGNIICLNEPGRPVIGYFTASEVSTSRILVKREQLQGPNELYESDGYENCGAVIVPLEDMTEANLAGRLINDRRFDLLTFELIGYAVYPAYCLDCRMHGGTTVRPAYWK